MSTMTAMLTTDGLVLFLFMSGAFIVSLVLRRQDIADILWGAGFCVVILTSLLVVEEVSLRGLLMSGMVLVWGGRLAARIGLRNYGKPEDFRYRQWRERWGRSFALRSYFQVFLLQGMLMMVVLASVLYVLARGEYAGLSWLDGVGMLIWLTGFGIEAIADYQLDRFKARPRNRGTILQSGLWRYSCHPNYFGEVLLWWGIYLMACATPGGWVTVFAPLTITLLILKVSGIPLIEEHYRDNPAYQEYRRRTSSFVPLPPRSIKE